MANVSVFDNWEKVPRYLNPYLRTVLLIAVKCHDLTTTEITDYQLERFSNKMFGRGWSSRDEPVIPTNIEDQMSDHQSLMGRRAADGAEERIVMGWNNELCAYLWQKAICNDRVLQYTVEDFIKPRLIRDHVKESCPWSFTSKRTRRLSQDSIPNLTNENTISDQDNAKPASVIMVLPVTAHETMKRVMDPDDLTPSRTCAKVQLCNLGRPTKSF